MPRVGKYLHLSSESDSAVEVVLACRLCDRAAHRRPSASAWSVGFLLAMVSESPCGEPCRWQNTFWQVEDQESVWSASCDFTR